MESIGVRAFSGCKKLRTVTFAEGSRLRTIEKDCFAKSGLEEIVLSSALENMNDFLRGDCGNLKIIWVREEVHECADCPVVILKEPTLVGGKPLRGMRRLK